MDSDFSARPASLIVAVQPLRFLSIVSEAFFQLAM